MDKIVTQKLLMINARIFIDYKAKKISVDEYFLAAVITNSTNGILSTQ